MAERPVPDRVACRRDGCGRVIPALPWSEYPFHCCTSCRDGEAEHDELCDRRQEAWQRNELPDLSRIDPFLRVQSGLNTADLFPDRDDGTCACGCGEKLTGRRRRWASDACGERAYEVFAIHAGYSNTVRRAVWKRDKGVCAACGRQHESRWSDDWEADHVLEVVNGGGGCGLENYQTLCKDPCHREKTARLLRRDPDPNQVDLGLEEVA